jgi:hypothetical protein
VYFINQTVYVATINCCYCLYFIGSIPTSEMSADAKASLAGLETVMVGGGNQVDYIKQIESKQSAI